MPVQALDASAAACHPLRVFVVDDSTVMLQAIRNVLETLPNLDLIGAATSAFDALTQIGQLHPDVVLMDIRMPNMNGLEATRQLHRDHPNVHVIIVTGMDPAVRRLCELAGAHGFVTKSRLHQELPAELARFQIDNHLPRPQLP